MLLQTCNLFMTSHAICKVTKFNNIKTEIQRTKWLVTLKFDKLNKILTISVSVLCE